MFQYWPVQYYAQRALTQGTPEYRDLQRRLFEQAQRQMMAGRRSGSIGDPFSYDALRIAGLGLTLNPSEAQELQNLGIPAAGTTTPNRPPMQTGLGLAGQGPAMPGQAPTAPSHALPQGYRWNWPDWYSPSDIEKVKGKYSLHEMMGTYIVPITESWLRQERERRKREAEYRRRGWE